PSWHRWRDLFNQAHITLINRPDDDNAFHPDAAAELEHRATTDASALDQQRTGLVHTYTPPALSISASRIRNLLACGKNPRYLLPDAVLADIMETGAY